MSQEHCHKNDEAFKKNPTLNRNLILNIRDMLRFEATMHNFDYRVSQEHCHKNNEAFKKKSYTKSQTYSNIRDMPIFETTMQNTRHNLHIAVCLWN